MSVPQRGPIASSRAWSAAVREPSGVVACMERLDHIAPTPGRIAGPFPPAMLRHLLAVPIFAALAAASPAACAADLRIGLSADVTSIDPHFVNITPNNNVAWHVFDALTHDDEDARLVLGLAESWPGADAP